MINLLQSYPAQHTVGRQSFDRLLRTYARAHTRTHAEGLAPPHVDEDLHPDDGYWITRRKLHGIHPWPGTGGLGGPRDPLRDRGTHYFHSTFNDLVLSGLVGLRAHDTHLEVHPLTLVRWFCASRLRLRGVDVTVVWDASGDKYGHGAGLHVWMDGRPIGTAPAQVRSGSPAPQRVKVAWDGSWLVGCSRSRASDRSSIERCAVVHGDEVPPEMHSQAKR
jgi:hypothetical protein